MAYCKYCNRELSYLLPICQKVCDKPECKRRQIKEHNEKYRNKKAGSHKIDDKQKKREGDSHVNLHSRCEWCQEEEDFFRVIEKIKDHDLWLCTFCLEVWQRENKKGRMNEYRKAPEVRRRKGKIVEGSTGIRDLSCHAPCRDVKL